MSNSQIDKKEEIQKLVQYYGYELNGYQIGLLQIETDIQESNHIQYIDNIEIANLIQFFESCYGKEINLKGVINYPQNNKERKGQSQKGVIKNELLLEYLIYSLHTLLEYNQEGEYQYKFNWEFKEYIEESPFSFTEPYSKEELEHIIKYEKDKNKKHNFNRNAKLGRRLKFVYIKFKEAGIFGKSKTKEFSFLYDWYVIVGKINKGKHTELYIHTGETGNDKYHIVKDLIKAYETFEKKYIIKKLQ